jgi:hypothetical protein
MIADGKSLWIEAQLQRFFLVPDDAPLPAGSFVIRTVLGEVREVDEAALAPFEIARAEADARMRAHVAGVFDEVKDALADSASRRRQEGSGSVAGQQLLDGLARIVGDLASHIAPEVAPAAAPPAADGTPAKPAKDDPR